GSLHQVPMTFVYGQRDAVGQRLALNAVEGMTPAPRLTQRLPIPDAFAAGHNLLAQGLDTEKQVLRTVKQLFERPDGATQLARPNGGASSWVFGGNHFPAR